MVNGTLVFRVTVIVFLLYGYGELSNRLVGAPTGLRRYRTCSGPAVASRSRALSRRYAPQRRAAARPPSRTGGATPSTPYTLPISYPRVSTMRSGSADEPPSEK